MDSSPIAKPSKRRKWFLLLTLTLLLSTLLLLITIFSSSTWSQYKLHRVRVEKPPLPSFAESKLKVLPTSTDPIPRLAYLISGSRGSGQSLKRVLRALYHPRNQYVVHLDLEASAEERLDLASFVRNEPVFTKVGNVRMRARANLVTYRGPTMVTNTLHAAAILLKDGGQWDWFINLSASDYPLVTQDDLLHVLSGIPRHYNFIEHTSDIGWKEYHRANPILIDPGLYTLQKSDVFWVPERRGVPTAYRLFTGSAWMMLSRPFIEYCLWGWDNLPRMVLMYYANFLSSPEGYFHTVICNSDEFKNTTINHDLHFISWDNPPQQHPHFLTEDDYDRMVESNAPFARKFRRDEKVLDRVDSELLGRSFDGFSRGGWLGNEKSSNSSIFPRYASANVTELRPIRGAERLKGLISRLLSADDFQNSHCI
ncbi:beta-glucuronosyltransferase GlcAT14B-like [Punica granatum]|uniref:Uncharacterized protein n=2 Tax=Punica granatum TaxID=22663 RepID=A0A218XTJ6_PUNGR|nr:beta-glucuronosyltransferase GlcAT14B-like [Punica granatum]OWM87976.1 hypothetical protein CDL15_Pgr000393 [Punica granatum]PKI49023.1 hypothetical protein CRG98_030610 [Punica granatum]